MLGKSDPAVIITGATGFIGRHVVSRLLFAGRRVVILVRRRAGLSGEERAAEVFGEAAKRRLLVVEADLATPTVTEGDLMRLASTVDTVIHCAGETSFAAGERESARGIQIDGPLTLLKMLRSGGLCRWIYISTAFVCGRREGMIYENEIDLGQGFHNTYERLKLELEIRLTQECRQLGVDLRIFRPSIVVGGAPSTPGGVPSNLLLAFLRLLVALSRRADAKNTPLRIQGQPQARFNIVPVEYVAAAIERLSEDPEASGKTIHLVAKNPPTQKRLLQMMSARLGLQNLQLVNLGEDLRNKSPLEMKVARLLSPYHDYLQQDVQFDDFTARRLLGRHHMEPPVIDGLELERFLKLAWFSERNGSLPDPRMGGSRRTTHDPLARRV
jgi:nucleoside-diphosphate-sugar epimerase